ncbi:carboxypeptidase-like protein [Pontibacter ummariensis]|uniref:CarboxypepD_reg-like domain-containing protein n=1 Tax=Pontibacter ummariensis TaxID=1610492 RepID=A0A239HNY7_9BACT|nr:carboxypeptidase-like regulatory domain-containing protein [Pontibacter ummariensis]PRY10361.1 carboxypeptidase-like protein [Pontibacter ummariensis]SNS83069.1 CarboxypepD_reg-like domain-containing protein [Pontibacter ummariensis]
MIASAPKRFITASGLQWLLLPLLAVLFLLLPNGAKAQGQQRVVQLSGFVATGDSLYGVAGVNVFVPGTSRGVQTNQYGFFSVPVLTGDSVLFSAIGYKKQYLIIPKNYSSQSYSIIMQMQEDPTELPTVEVFPWPTERDFREAIAKVKLPDEGRAIATRNLDPERLEALFESTPMDGAGNFKFWNQQQIQQQQNRYMYPTISPFAIPKLIDAIFNGNSK